jgi:hypothetical protein
LDGPRQSSMHWQRKVRDSSPQVRKLDERARHIFDMFLAVDTVAFPGLG